MKLKTILLAVLAAGTLNACSSTVEPIRYYQLPDSAFRLPEQVGKPIAVQIVLAEHLREQGLVYQTDDVHVNFAQKNVWANALDDALAANLANKLNAQTTQVYIPKKWANDVSGSLKIYIDRFQGTHRGVTEISGYGQWSNGKTRAFHVQTPQQGDGYAAMVQSLNAGLHEVAQQLAR